MTQNVRLERPWGNGRIVYERNATANDSDKSFTVPTGKIWELRAIFNSFSTTATVGNRFINVSITDGTNAILPTANVPAQAASVSNVVTMWAYGSSGPLTSTSVSSVAHIVSLGVTPLLPEGYVVRVFDSAAIDPAADDLTVVLYYIEYDA